jgi:hypothetical protein
MNIVVINKNTEIIVNRINVRALIKECNKKHHAFLQLLYIYILNDKNKIYHSLPFFFFYYSLVTILHFLYKHRPRVKNILLDSILYVMATMLVGTRTEL